MSEILLNQYDQVATPVPGKTAVYTKSDGLVYAKGPDGIERSLMSPGVIPANNILSVFRNRLINGGFSVNQRGASVGASGNLFANNVYCIDRWFAQTETGNLSVRQLTDPEATQTECLSLLQPDLVAKRIGAAQIVESANIRHLKGQQYSLSGRIRSSLAQPIRFAVLHQTGTADSVAHQLVNSWTSGNYTANNFFTTAAAAGGLTVGTITPVAGVWTPFSLTGSFPAGLKNATVIIWTEGTFAQNNTLEIGQVQLEPGAVASSYEQRFFGQELALCQRYYYSSFPLGVLPAMGVTTGDPFRSQSQYTLATNWFATRASLNFPVTMRAVPSWATFNTINSGNYNHSQPNGNQYNWGYTAITSRSFEACTSGGSAAIDTTYHGIFDADL